jgi:hypothetical protein
MECRVFLLFITISAYFIIATITVGFYRTGFLPDANDQNLRREVP